MVKTPARSKKRFHDGLARFALDRRKLALHCTSPPMAAGSGPGRPLLPVRAETPAHIFAA
jgi:hypothetical protein